MDYSGNIILLADSYKTTHQALYPPDMTKTYCYFESRGGKFPSTLFFGLQYFLKKYLVGPVVTTAKIEEAKKFLEQQVGPGHFRESGWKHIVEHHGGHLPVKIRAIPEGTIVPTKMVLFTVETTDPDVPWLSTYLETLLSQVWYPTTVATSSRYQKEIIRKFLNETSDETDTTQFKLHDYGFRGVSSVESAAMGGAAHLVNFRTSDTIAGVIMARQYYGCEMAGTSGPASEHSTVISWGRDRELDSCRRLMDAYPQGFLAGVSDSFDLFHACREIWGKQLKKKIEERGLTNGGMPFHVRPDSGDPVQVVLEVLEILGKSFGTTKNSKGYRLLPKYLRVIQGDGVSLESLTTILEYLKVNGWSADNVSFGSGGALLQRVDRDTQRCAYKLSYIEHGRGDQAVGTNVYKAPLTDPGKRSKKGRLTLQEENGIFTTFEEGTGDSSKDMLQDVFLNGVLLNETTFEDVRRRADDDLPIVQPSSRQ